MINPVFSFLRILDNIFWGYIACVLIVVLGFILTVRSRFFQIRYLPEVVTTFFQSIKNSHQGERGVHPLKAFFASTGGMIGVGNIVGIITAIQLGGPGALIWLWIAGILGGIVKYYEIYLGLKYRVANQEGGYDGGPMYFLKKAFTSRWIPIGVSVLLCIYGVEIYQFSVIADSVSTNWHINRLVVVAVLLGSVLYAALGGVARIGKICSWIVPFFLLIYFAMGIWILGHEWALLPSILTNVFKSAFTGHAAIGGFAGSSVILAIQHGFSRAAYSADIGVGYDSIIQSETAFIEPYRQARLAILGVFIDNMICTFSILIVLVSGSWTLFDVSEGSELIQLALSQYFPYMKYFVPFFLIVTGYTTIITYLVVGIKCARYLSPRWGKRIYLLYGIASFVFFSFISQYQALIVMSVSGAMLLSINILGIFRLRKDVVFEQSSYSIEEIV